METKPVKADPKAIYARRGHAHVDQKALRRHRVEEQKGAAWRRAHAADIGYK